MTERRAALITGAARRLGRAMASHLAARGWDIGVPYRDSEEDAQCVAKEVEQVGARCRLYQADLEDAAACERLVAGFYGHFPNAALLVNNASTFEHDTISSLSVERWTRQMTVNALTPILLARHFHDAIGGPGCIINMLDQKVTNASPDFFSYTLSKMALCNATDLLAMAFSPKTRVNGIAPGLVLRSGAQTQEEYEEEHDHTPLGVGPTTQEICKAVSFIAGTPSMTGQVITLDGGRHMVRALKYEDLPGE